MVIIPGKQRNTSSSENDFDGGRPDLEQLIVASVRTLSTDDYSPSQIESALTHLIADGTYYVAESDGRIVGGRWVEQAAVALRRESIQSRHRSGAGIHHHAARRNPVH